MNRFLTRAGLGAARQETGTTSVTASQVSLLTDATSAAVCARLNAMFGGGGAAGEYRWAYYKAGTRYFVSIEHVDPPNTRRIGFVPFFVLDADLNQLGGFTM